MLIVTGANGYVGQHMAPHLKKFFRTSKIICLVNKGKDSLEKKGRRIIRDCKLESVTVDLVEGRNLSKIPKNASLIIHMAGNTDTSTSDHRANDLGTVQFFNSLGKLGPKTHIIYTSTTVMMSGRVNCDRPFDEHEVPSPTNEYGRTKMHAELFLREQCKKHKFRLTIVRINTIYGRDPRTHKMFEVLRRHILNGSLITRINWPGKTSIIHVDDVIDALLKFAKRKPLPGEPDTFIICAESLSLSKISEIMHMEMGIDYRPIRLPVFFWKLCSILRVFIPFLERFLPAHMYNVFWRTGLVVDDVICTDGQKAIHGLRNFRPKKFGDGVKDVV